MIRAMLGTTKVQVGVVTLEKLPVNSSFFVLPTRRDQRGEHFGKPRSILIFFRLVIIKLLPYMIPFSKELYGRIDRHGRLHLVGSRRVERTELTKEGCRAVLSGPVTVVGIRAGGQGLAGGLCAAHETVPAVNCALGTLHDLVYRTMRRDALQFGAMDATGLGHAKPLISALYPADASDIANTERAGLKRTRDIVSAQDRAAARFEA